MTNKKSARDWAIFMNINDERFSDVERMTAIEHIAYAPTHNSITKAMMLDVIRYLLTAQQPRVLTLEEVLGGDECWIEGRSGACGYGDALLTNDAERVEFHRPHTISTLDFYGYGRAWRCWDRRPTDEQREATPWDEPPKEGDGE